MRDRTWAWVGLSLAALLVATPVAAQTKLTLYTSQPDKDAATTVAGFKAANPGIDVDIYRSGTTEIMSKLAAEIAGGAPRADVLLIADAVSMEILKKQNLLAPYKEAKVEGLSAGSYDPDMTYFGSKLITTGIAYNTGAGFKPTSWKDLEKPEYKNQISMPSPLYSGAAAIMLGAFVQKPDLGWDFFKALKANAATPVQGNGAVLQAIAGGEKAAGVLVDYLAFNAKAKGSPIEFVVPSEGVTAVTEPVAIVRSTKSPDAAKKFVDFILSPAGQKLAVTMGYMPARADVGTPDWLPKGTTIKLMPFDAGAIAAGTEAQKKQFSSLFGG